MPPIRIRLQIVKTFSTTIFLSLAISGAVAQGLANFYNTPTTAVNIDGTPISGPPGTYYFGLLTSTTGPARLPTFTGVYGTNLATAGLFSGGTVAVPGWAPGTEHTYYVAGWTATLGHDWNPQWLIVPPSSSQYPAGGAFGISINTAGVAGGTTSTGSVPPLDLSTGFATGSYLYLGSFPPVPEPSTAALFCIGSILLLPCCRCRKR